jgi:hypothetical protein
MFTRLDDNAKTHRTWNGRELHYHGKISLQETPVSMKLTWREEKHARPKFVGCFSLDMRQLCAGEFVRREDGQHYRLRFQRTGQDIEIAATRDGPALRVGTFRSKG